MAGRFLGLSLLVVCLGLASAGCGPDGDIQITSLTFQGVKGINEGELRSVLQTKKGSWIPWGTKRYFDRRAFDADLRRIEAFYRDRGYPDARVSSFDVKLNGKQDKVDIAVNISEGAPLIVEAIEVTGMEVLPEKLVRRLPDSLPLHKDRPFDRQLALASREQILNVLRDYGYAYADVMLNEEDAGATRRRIVFAATPGAVAHVGPVEIVGVKTVGEEVVRRQLTFKPGDLYTRKEVRNSQRKLYGLELFEFVNVEPRTDQANPAPEIPTRVTVAEGKQQKVTFGVGYGTEEQARARIRWDHLNFFGDARHAGFEGKWSSLDRGVRVDLTQPYLFSSNLSGTFDGQAWQASEPAYSLNSLGGRFTLKYQHTAQTSMAISISDQYQRSTISNAALEDFKIRNSLISLGLDPRTGVSEGTLSAVAFDVTHNTTTNVLDAHQGYMLSGHVEQAGKWLLGTFNYVAVTMEARHYAPLGRKAVLANRLRVGSIDPLGGTTEASVPFYKRFFLGGASSVRGWGRLEVSPLSGFGLPIGGHSMIEGSSELRLPMWGKLGAVGFVDFGNVWSGALEFHPGDLRYAVGPGFRYLTPVGPARVDFGFQLNPIPGLRVNGVPEARPWRVHFSIGQAF